MKNFAIIGAGGYIAPRHLKAIQALKQNLILAYDVSDSVGILDSYYPDAAFFINFEEFYDYALCVSKDPSKKIDYVSICSPNYMHLSHVSLALRLGCDVICEKPLVPFSKDVELLKNIESETRKKVYNILQLRYHPEIIRLKDEVLKNDKIYEVDLTYITSRGDWYLKSWKADPKKSFGIERNIGVHFFDMLQFIFGDFESGRIIQKSELKSAGTLKYKKANVKWFLSIDSNDLPSNIGEQRTFRSIMYDNETLEFSKGFTNLHTQSYSEILSGRGFGLDEAIKSILTLEQLER